MEVIGIKIIIVTIIIIIIIIVNHQRLFLWYLSYIQGDNENVTYGPSGDQTTC
jgi:hypothetical protein